MTEEQGRVSKDFQNKIWVVAVGRRIFNMYRLSAFFSIAARMIQ